MPHLTRKSFSGFAIFFSWKADVFHERSADMAELADAPDLGSGVYDVQVQVLLSALDIFRKAL